MDLNGLANPSAELVNPNIPVSIQASTGYTIGAGLKQVPSYAAPVSGFAQLQEITSSDLKQVDGLNIQGDMRKLYVPQPLNAVIRPNSQGGDLVTIAGQLWLVVKVLEQWWNFTTALIVLQEPVS